MSYPTKLRSGQIVDSILVDQLDVSTTYSIITTSGLVTQEKWLRLSDSTKLKTVDYSYTGKLVTQEVHSVFASDGVTLVAQLTTNYVYTGTSLTGASTVRNI